MILQKGTSLRQRFQALAEKWREECKWTSSLNEMAMHPAYQQIIAWDRMRFPSCWKKCNASRITGRGLCAH